MKLLPSNRINAGGSAVDDSNSGKVKSMNTRRHILAAALAVASLFAANAYAHDAAKGNGMTFHGKVEAVTDKGLTVNGEKLEGWMDAMTMSYPVDKPEVLKMVKAGDTIMATVYKGDITLHDVQVMPAGKSDKKKSK
jgi:Cu/Ag efflux protein CusF